MVSASDGVSQQYIFCHQWYLPTSCWGASFENSADYIYIKQTCLITPVLDFCWSYTRSCSEWLLIGCRLCYLSFILRQENRSQIPCVIILTVLFFLWKESVSKNISIIFQPDRRLEARFRLLEDRVYEGCGSSGQDKWSLPESGFNDFSLGDLDMRCEYQADTDCSGCFWEIMIQNVCHNHWCLPLIKLYVGVRSDLIKIMIESRHLLLTWLIFHPEHEKNM